MDAKYMFNLKWPLPDGVQASFTAQGDNLKEVMANAKTFYDQIAPKAAQANSNGNGQATPQCPEHHKAVPSKYGGLYCPTQTEDGFCTWNTKPKKGAKK